MFDRLREQRAEYRRRLEVAHSHVSESPVRLSESDEPQPTDDGGVVWLHVDDEAGWRTAREDLDEMPWWSAW